MISTFLSANKASLKRKTKLLFLLCFLKPSVVLSYNFPPDRPEIDAENEIGWLVAPLPIIVEGMKDRLNIKKKCVQ